MLKTLHNWISSHYPLWGKPSVKAEVRTAVKLPEHPDLANNIKVYFCWPDDPHGLKEAIVVYEHYDGTLEFIHREKETPGDSRCKLIQKALDHAIEVSQRKLQETVNRDLGLHSCHHDHFHHV